MSEHDDKGCSEEKCLRCGWVMGSRPLNCNNDNTPHSFPSTVEALRQARNDSYEEGLRYSRPFYEQGQRDAIDAAVQRVEALPHSLECVTRDPNYSRPCNCLRGDALDAIKREP
jgi:hypothetical protein